MNFLNRLCSFIKRDWFVLLIIAAYFVLMNALNMGCIFEWLTGISCPGCGLTRAWLCVLRLDFVGAFYYHPLWLIIPVVVLLYMVYDGSFMKNKRAQRAFTAAFGALALGVYAYRMFFMENSPIGIDVSSSAIAQLLSFFNN